MRIQYGFVISESTQVLCGCSLDTLEKDYLPLPIDEAYDEIMVQVENSKQYEE